MVSGEIRFIQKALIKERDAEVFRKIRPSPILWEPFKDSAPPRTAAGNSETNCQRRTHLCPWPFIHYIQLLATAQWTNLEAVTNAQNGVSHRRQRRYERSGILITAQWTPPRYWQRRNELLHDVGNGAMNSSLILETEREWGNSF